MLMELNQVIAALENLSDDRAIAIAERFGLIAKERYLGVNRTKLKELAKQVGKSQPLANQLWDCGIHDAKMLATYISEPKKISKDQLEQWITQVHSYDVSDMFGKNIIAKSPFGQELCLSWYQSPIDDYKRTVYSALYEMAKDAKVPTNFFLPFLTAIEGMQQETNWVKDAMNFALMTIGGKRPELFDHCAAIAEKIGVVDVDYGDTSCKTIQPTDFFKRKAATA
jgi:3-methyladenine DNA glycosylase AlkD